MNRADTPHARRRPKIHRLGLTRNDWAVILWALESVIEDAKYDGGLTLAVDEIRLAERVRKLMGLRP